MFNYLYPRKIPKLNIKNKRLSLLPLSGALVYDGGASHEENVVVYMH